MAKTILIVEDNSDEAFMLRKAIKKCSVPVDAFIANTGEEAIRHLFPETGPAHAPDLILLDLKLPGMSGFDILRRVKSTDATRFIPVVILSSSELMLDRIEAYSAGAFSFIRKPVGFGDLVSQLDLLARYWLVLNQPPVPWP